MFGLLLVGCLNTTTVIKVATEAIEVGSDFEEGATEMTPVVSGDMSIQDVWKKFVQAANDENLEIMTELEADDIEIYGSSGAAMKGSKHHIDYCRELFKVPDPNGQIRLMIANARKKKMVTLISGSPPALTILTLMKTLKRFSNNTSLTLILKISKSKNLWLHQK
jgi:hypothetical protein